MQKSPEILKLLKKLAPGTDLRIGLDNILSAKNGALIVVSDDKKMTELFDGGFFLNCAFTPQRLFELSKMDGAIILDSRLEQILYANVQLHPSASISTNESGTRHRIAERFAKQTNSFVISISERRTVVTIYQGEMRYRLTEVSSLMIETNQAVRMVERYRMVIDKLLDNLTMLEFEGLVTLAEVDECIQKFIFLFKVGKEAENYIVELGEEGRLVKIQLSEIMQDMDKTLEYLLIDYYNPKKELEVEKIFQALEKIELDEILDLKNLSGFLGYERSNASLDREVISRGYRILSKITRLNQKDVEKIITHFAGFDTILNSDIDDILEIYGISKTKANILKNGLQRLRNTLALERDIKLIEEKDLLEM